MTAQELAKVQEEVRKDKQHDYVPSSDSTDYDRYGNRNDGHMFDHTEDVFPY